MSDQKQLIVCGLDTVETMVSSSNANALVSVLHHELIPRTPDAISRENHFKLAIDDVESAFDGLHHANHDDIERLCQFASDWDAATGATGAGTVVVHCYAGVSRSTAAAFVMLCTLNPTLSENALARYLRAQSPSATPNRLIVSLGDKILGRNGKMIKAIQSIGRGSSSISATPFTLQAAPKSALKQHVLGSAAA